MTERRTNSRALSPAAREALRDGVARAWPVLAELARRLLCGWAHQTPPEEDERGGFWVLALTPMGDQWRRDIREVERLRAKLDEEMLEAQQEVSTAAREYVAAAREHVEGVA